MLFTNKVALITGGTSGIGLVTARRLLDQGATTIITGRKGERLSAAEREFAGKATVVAADMAKPDDIDRLMATVKAKHERLDVLVVNAGVSDAPAITDLEPASYAALMDVNCRGATFAFVYALPLMSDGAAVVFVGSVAGRKGQPGDPLYAGSKGFVRAFARSLGTDPGLLARGIRVNSVTPGPIDTPLTAQAMSDPRSSAFVTQQLVPMKRWGRAEEVADAILFLASDAAAFTTGGEITVDGGMSHA